MKPHPRIRKTIKWGGAALTVLLVVVWVGSGWVGPYWRIVAVSKTPIATPAWVGEDAVIAFRRDDGSASYLFGKAMPDAIYDIGDPEAVNPVSSPEQPQATVYRFVGDAGSLWKGTPASLEDWDKLNTPVGYLHHRWTKDQSPFSVDWKARQLFFHGQPISAIGRWSFQSAVSPDGEYAAVISAKGMEHDFSFAPAGGGATVEYGGPFFVQLFSVKTGKPVGRAVRLTDLGRSPGVDGNWTADGRQFVCVDYKYEHVWFIAREEFEAGGAASPTSSSLP